jgi:hypothetical protein
LRNGDGGRERINTGMVKSGFNKKVEEIRKKSQEG